MVRISVGEIQKKKMLLRFQCKTYHHETDHNFFNIRFRNSYSYVQFGC